MKKKIFFGATLVIGLAVLYWVYAPPSVPDKEIDFSEDSIERGHYLVQVGGCISCHIDQSGESEALVGGFALATEFGTFYAPNITPDEETGIGGWTAKDFFLAVRHGRKASGGSYAPAFPYRTYAGLADQDVLDIAAYLMSEPAVKFQPPQNDLPAWLMPSLAMPFWNKMADFFEGELPAIDTTDPVMVRGAYLARELGHCGECHTPRSSLGFVDLSREFAGNKMGEEVYDPIDAEALSTWTEDDFDVLLFLGFLPDGDVVAGHMAEVIEYNTSPLTDEDRAAMVKFFMRPAD